MHTQVHKHINYRFIQVDHNTSEQIGTTESLQSTNSHTSWCSACVDHSVHTHTHTHHVQVINNTGVVTYWLQRYQMFKSPTTTHV